MSVVGGRERSGAHLERDVPAGASDPEDHADGEEDTPDECLEADVYPEDRVNRRVRVRLRHHLMVLVPERGQRKR